MIIAARVKRFLDSHRIGYQVLSHCRTLTLKEAAQEAQIPSHSMARAVVLEDGVGILVVVLPLAHKLDFAQLEKISPRPWKILPRVEVDKLFFDCEPGSHPPLGEAYGLNTIIDEALVASDQIFFEPGTHTALVGLSFDDFHFLTSNAKWARISVPMDSRETQNSKWEPKKELTEDLKRVHFPCLEQINRCFQEVYPWPKLPQLAHQIFNLNHSPRSTTKTDLKQIFHQHPSIKEWVMHIEQGLESKKACHLAFALCAAQGFDVQHDGPIGLTAFWGHACKSAQLAMGLAAQMPSKACDPDLAYLCGLMHNFGYLLMGHFFSPEFKLLNHLILAHPKSSVIQLEKKLIGMGRAQRIMNLGHAQMGACLMESWQMPQEVITCAREHHNLEYQGAHAPYVQLLYLTGQLLRYYGIGEGPFEALEPQVIRSLGLTPLIANQELSKVLEADLNVPKISTSPLSTPLE